MAEYSDPNRKGFKLRGAPMKRNFGIGKPGAPNDKTVNAYTQQSDDATLTTSTNTTSNPSTTNTFVDDNSAGMGGGNTTVPPVTTDNTSSNTSENESYLDKNNINKDGTKNLPERNDGLKGGLLDNWIRKNQGKSFREILGLSKEQIAARKAKKNAKIEAARLAVGSGTETLKQAKLVTRSNKKENRKKKREIRKAKRDKKRLAIYRKKNPVTGKEAINLVTDGGNKSLV